MKDTKWELIDRKKVFNSKFVSVYEDKVKLPDGKIIEDYTVIEKPNIVIIVAIDSNNKVVVLKEYKHGAADFLYTLPAGHINHNESVIDAAKRELEEETGLIASGFEESGILFEYPSKDMHKVHVVKATGVSPGVKNLEDTETISSVEFVSVPEIKEQITKRIWKSSSALAAFLLTGIFF